jgi:hypothetical protein
MADDATIGDVTWVNVNNAKTSDDVYTTSTLTLSAVEIDGFSETGADGGTPLYTSGGYLYAGQSFTNANTVTLDSCRFFLTKIGSPTGTATAKIFAHTGTYGSGGKPTGSALATSDTLDVSTLSASPTYGWKTLSFTGANRITLNASTYYCIELTWAGGDASNYIRLGSTSTGGHSGNSNYSTNGTSWSSLGSDRPFTVYGIPSATSHYLKASNFSCSLPGNKTTIKGILVEIKQKSTATTLENEIKIVKADGSIGIVNKSTGATLPTDAGYVSYGSSSDLWGESWTASDINNSNFGVVFSTISPTSLGISSVDHIRITIYYVISPLPMGLY